MLAKLKELQQRQQQLTEQLAQNDAGQPKDSPGQEPRQGTKSGQKQGSQSGQESDTLGNQPGATGADQPQGDEPANLEDGDNGGPDGDLPPVNAHRTTRAGFGAAGPPSS